MAIPTYRDVDLALLLELVRVGRAVRPSSTYEGVARHFPNLSPEDRARTRQDGRTKVFPNTVHWARDHARRRGLLVDRKGEWEPSDSARAALTSDLASRGVPEARASAFIDSSATLDELLGKNWAKSPRQRQAATETNQGEALTPRSTDPAPIAPTIKESRDDRQGDRASVKADLIRRLNAMEGYEFEQFIGRVLDAIGFRDTQVVGRSGDEGVDLITYFYTPLLTAKVAVQVKRQAANVGPPPISYLRDRWGRRSDRLMFITTADFTAGAREVAQDGERPVQLITGEHLVDVMVEHNIAVRARPQVTYEIDEDYFTAL